MLLTGLISLIPIIGQMVLLGWMLAALDNLRANRQELPEAGFSYIGRGSRLFVVQLVYGLAIGVVASVILLVGFGLLAAGSNEGSTAALATTFGGLIVAVGYLITFALAVCYYLLTPVIVLRTDRGGIGGGLNVSAVVADVVRLPGPTLLAGLLTYVGILIAGVGAILCGIGIFLTAAYGYSVVAGVVRFYEQQLPGQGAASPPPTGSILPNPPTQPTSN